MVKTSIIVLLSVLSLLLCKANIDTFRMTSSSLKNEINHVQKESSKKSTPPPLNLNPKVEPQLPDLNKGYIFNAQRFLAKDSRPSKAGKGYDQNIRIDDVVFSGALLGEGYKKALVTYPLAPKPTSRAIRPGGPQAQPPSGRSETAQLEIGDQLGGYTVKEITSDFISFIKGSDTIKKTLFDPDKTRRLSTPRPQTSSEPTKPTPHIVSPRRATPLPTQRP